MFQTHVPLTGNPYRSNYAVSHDGQRFLDNIAVDERLSAPLTILLNWTNLVEK